MSRTERVLSPAGRLNGGNLIYRIPAGFSVGRAITTILRDLKAHPPKANVIIYGAAEATISGKGQVILAKYRTRSQRNPLWRSGPLYPRTPARFLRRMIRGMLNYKSTQRKLYRKIMVDPSLPCQGVSRNLEQLCPKDLRVRPKITLAQLTAQL